MDIYILGSCSGTEPQIARHHTSWALKINDRLYWFDAGENCSYTAHTNGLDIVKSAAVFLSHPHLDHVGGLPNLFWSIGKVRSCRGEPWQFELPVYTASVEQVQSVFALLSETEFPCTSPVIRLQEGAVFTGDITVEARGNNHLPYSKENLPRSFSFRITAEGKSIVYSGDATSIKELEDWIMDCDLLLMENGHHKPVEVCKYIAGINANIRHLLFVHHGRTMLADPAGVVEECRKLVRFPVDAAEDAMHITL